ncbi:MAG: homoserine O-succinyltransferase [Spirochaetes bacterium]|nr:homoserine O-succinyltransferase [Spirochaetota bacterium]
MPINIPDDLPANRILTEENIFVMNEERAFHQDIRPLEIAVLNLMPKKIETETQLLRLIGNSPIQVNVTLIKTETYESRNISQEHLLKFYTTFNHIKSRKYDGLIITGAPVENMKFEDVIYWQELCSIMEWSKTNVFSTFHICWGAQAGLYYHFGIPKKPLEKKLSGVFQHGITESNSRLMRGFDDCFHVPHSRFTCNDIADVKKTDGLQILSVSDEAGLLLCATKDLRQVYMSGHSEYDADTLKLEYFRDKEQGLNPDIPVNYFTGDDPSGSIIVKWRSHSNLLFVNWLNYAVYQQTPYNLKNL